MSLYESNPGIAISLMTGLVILAITALVWVFNNVIRGPRLSPMSDRERNMVATLGKEIETLNQQLWARNQEIAQLRDRIKHLERPTFGFDDEDD